MILQFCLLGLSLLFAPLIPWLLSPLGFSLTGALVIQQANPWILSIFTVGIGTITAAIVRMIQNHIIRKLYLGEEIQSSHRFRRLVQSIHHYIKHQEDISRISRKWETYLSTKTGRYATFLFAVFCFIPVIPDLIAIRLLYKKISFGGFIVAVLIGKSLTFVPLIFLGKSLLQRILI